MPDQTRYVFEIYHEGVTFKAKVRGNEQYLREKAFLGELTGFRPTSDTPAQSIPDPATDFYALDDDQLAAYSAFRKENAGAERQGK